MAFGSPFAATALQDYSGSHLIKRHLFEAAAIASWTLVCLRCSHSPWAAGLGLSSISASDSRFVGTIIAPPVAAG